MRYVCLISLYICFNFFPFYILFSSSLVKASTFENTKKKCKVLEIIPHDLDRNHCEISIYVCIRMLFSVAT